MKEEYVEITTPEKKFTGILIKSEKNRKIIKLNSGYNISIKASKVRSIKTLKKSIKKTTKPKKQLKSKSLKTILILHTGGTIASKIDYSTGGVSSKFSPEDLIQMFPELKQIANIESKLLQNMWSDDLRFSHFKKIAKEIQKNINKVDGIIIGIGTDNLAVASAALSFMIENSPIPILFVGAQRSSDRASSDANMNLICAAEFIAKTNFTGIAICMHESSNDDICVILPPCKTRKLHTSRRDAFKPVNTNPIARIDYKTSKIYFIEEHKKQPNQKLTIKPKIEEKTALLKITVNMTPEQFNVYKGYKGLVIEGTGLGHTPLDTTDEETKIHEKIKDSIKSLIKSGTIIVMTSQCIFGKTNMNVYSKGIELKKLGVISGEDMLPETAFVKLAWLLANHPKEVKQLIQENLRGEINKRLDTEFLD